MYVLPLRPRLVKRKLGLTRVLVELLGKTSTRQVLLQMVIATRSQAAQKKRGSISALPKCMAPTNYGREAIDIIYSEVYNVFMNDRKRLKLITLTCLRCGHEWIPNRPMEPKVCPRCKSPYWNTPKWKGVKK